MFLIKIYHFIIIVKSMFKKQQQSEKELEMIVEHLENGQVKRYQKGRVLGKGGFAECFEFISEETGKRYAAKVIEKETLAKGKAKQKLQSEIMIHKAMRHRHIVKFQHFFEDHQNVYILLELCCNNTLSELLKRRKILTQVQAKFYMLQIIQAVRHIHSKRVIHRDLKLGNFFLADGLEVKVGDFGLATTLAYEGERRKTVCGTPNYIAPEILEGKRGHSYEVDVWSLGVIAFALLFGKPPFETNEVKTTYEKIKVCEYAFPKIMVSNTAKEFIAKMLKLNPADRATIDQLLADDFLKLSGIPRTLPLSTLACPPSKAFLEQAKNDPRALSESKLSRNEEFQIGLNSSRTEKQTTKYQCLLANEKLDSFRNHAKSRKSQRSIGSLTRTISTAVIANRKKINSNIAEQPRQNHKVWLTYFQQHQKYGLFYVLSNGVVGMRFNDISCITTSLHFKRFKYFVLKNNTQESQVENFQMGQERESLTKKMKIINHFYKEYKIKNLENHKTCIKVRDSQPSAYVIAHFNTNNCSLFWLSNQTYHAKFKDQTDILSENEYFTYLSRDRKETIHRSDKLSEATEDIRQKYALISGLMKKIKRKQQLQQEEKKEMEKKEAKEKAAEKENHCMLQSSSSSKLIKPKEKELVRRQFSSTANLQLQKRPLHDYISNK